MPQQTQTSDTASQPDGSPGRAPAIILNADDFGRSASTNAAVMLAYRQGLLTSASLMVGEDAFPEAVRLARAAPGLAVGLHLVVASGRACLPPQQIRHIVDESGHFPRRSAAGWSALCAEPCGPPRAGPRAGSPVRTVRRQRVTPVACG